MIEKLEALDRELFLWLNGLHASWLDDIMWYLSGIPLMVPVFLFAAYYGFKKGGIKDMFLIIGGVGLCVLLADRISVELFKEVFQRYRPTHNLEIKDLVHVYTHSNGEVYRGGKFSFVSSHATNSFAMAMYVFLFLRQHSKYWGFLFLWAAIVCYTRIYLGVHYPGDIIGGAILGSVIGCLVYWLSKKLRPLLFKEGQKLSA